MSDMKKLLQIVDGSKSAKPISEAVSFSVSMSGDTPTDVADTFNKIMGLSSPAPMSPPVPAPLPPMAKTIGIVDKMGPDYRVKEADKDSWANQDEPEYKDINYMTKDLAGGLNRPKKMFKHSYKQGDNPMSMEESLMSEYQKFKTGK